MDFFDPQSDDYLMSELVYRDLFELREILSQLVDVNKKLICKDELIGVIARKRPVTARDLRRFVDDHSIQSLEGFQHF